METKCYCPTCMNEVKPGANFCTVCGNSLKAENEIHQLPVNTLLRDRYLVGKVLGEGGFGITYIGKDEMLDLTVAIKEYYPAEKANRVNTYQQNITVSASVVTDYQGGRDKFLSEARTLAIFSREPGIVCIRDFFEENNTAYIVMEYLDGSSLWTELYENGPMSFDKVYGLLKPVMKSLQRVHDRGLVHRDISPANLMLLKDGTVKLLDFGTARNMNLGGEKSLSVIMKPGFAPEEQYDPHGEQGPWTDVYGLCATIYKLITNETPVNSMNRVFKDELVRPLDKGAVISPAQERVLLRGMAIKRKDRIQTMDELMEAFDRADEETIYSQRAIQRLEDETTLKGKDIAAAAGGNALESQQLNHVIFQQDLRQTSQPGSQSSAGVNSFSQRGMTSMSQQGMMSQVNQGTMQAYGGGNGGDHKNSKLITALILGIIGLALVIAALYFVPKWIEGEDNKKSSEAWGGVGSDDSETEEVGTESGLSEEMPESEAEELEEKAQSETETEIADTSSAEAAPETEAALEAEKAQETEAAPNEQSEQTAPKESADLPQTTEEEIQTAHPNQSESVFLADCTDRFISASLYGHFEATGEPTSIYTEIEDVAIGDWKDILGNIWPSSFKFWVGGPTGAPEEINYTLAGCGYDTLVCNLVCGEYSSGRCQSGTVMSANIYLDGSLAYSNSNISDTSGIDTVTLDITGVNLIKIVVESSDTHTYGECIVSAELTGFSQTGSDDADPGIAGPTMIAELIAASAPSPADRGYLPTAVSASSEIYNVEKNYDYRAIKAVDGDTATCWQENNPAEGIGEWIRLDYDGEITVNSFVMFLGYGKAADGFYWNSRPCRLKVTFSDGNYVILNCLDVYGYQSIQLPTPVVTTSLTIEIESTYMGEKWQDTSIAEIVVQ